MSSVLSDQKFPSCHALLVSIAWAGRVYTGLATVAQVAMVSWLLPGSWLGTQEACPQWPCLKLSMASLQETASSRHPALALPSGVQAVDSPVATGLPVILIMLASRHLRPVAEPDAGA